MKNFNDFISDMVISESMVTESELTPDLKNEIEKVVLDLKKNSDSFKKNYGDKWESVMYATATNIAKKHLSD